MNTIELESGVRPHASSTARPERDQAAWRAGEMGEGASETRRRLSRSLPVDRRALLGSAMSSVCLSTVVYYALAPWSGALGYVVVCWVLFVAMYALVVSLDNPSVVVRDGVARVIANSLAVLLLSALVLVVGFTFYNGRSALRHWGNFFTQDMAVAGPLDPLSLGGILHGVAGTLIMMTIVLAIVVPLGISAAVFLSELRGPLPRFVRTVVEAMTALPSIVAGLFIYAIIKLGLGAPSGLAAAFALSIMALPIIIRSADVVLRLVPGTLKEAAAATGASQWRTIWFVTLPTARSGLVTATILGMARAVGETSPVLLTSGIATQLNVDPLHNPMTSLPLLTFSLTRSPQEAFITRGFGAAAVLMALVLFLFVLARRLGGRGPGQLSRGQIHRRVRQSERDLARMTGRADTAHAPSLGRVGPTVVDSPRGQASEEAS